MHKVLAIETSCDETSVSIVSNIGDTFRIHSNIIASQIEDHSKWGGVVPELAARKHLELLPFVYFELPAHSLATILLPVPFSTIRQLLR